MIKNKHIAFFTAFLAVSLFSQNAFSTGFFSGYAGEKTDMTFDGDSDYVDPELKLQAFFAGQFNLTNNLLAHMEFSIATDDLIENSIFKETPAQFQIDEMSLIHRHQFPGADNYFSLFMGTYEPIGSDIFLQRQFGILPISSKLTESWLGLYGSVVYPIFGIGFSDVIHYASQPFALGAYFYMNHETSDDYYVLNADLRAACVYRFFTMDFAGGVGAPLETPEDNDVFFVIDTLYAHAGINMLIGNNYTTALYLQGGIFDIPLKKQETAFEPNGDNTYILIEPRFRINSVQLHLTAYSMPAETVKKMLFISDPLGANLLIYNDALMAGSHPFLFGINATWSFPDASFRSLTDFSDLISSDWNITFAPYISTRFFNGDIHVMLQVRPMDFGDAQWASALTLNLGYKTQL